ncbi:4'-phosphopantetheinyl transferase superfamily protein [Streptomyces sp. E11-3]|uniref:4'-phosphopantetheinyl transferase family protein n=1 Tax=Streptomyces sp. E11-3 TaxID=3110112 RepID=UPI003980364E
MTAPGNSTVGPPLRDPVEVLGREDTWDRVRTDLAECGSVLLCARLEDWAPQKSDGPELRQLLGRDWSRYLDIAHPEIRLRYAASRTLLKYAAGAVLHGDPEELELSYGPTGRPYLRGCDQIDISLSHTENLLLVGLTTLGLIGVDAELADRQLYSKGMGRHVCTPYELVTLANLPESDRNAGLVRLWTLKEAYSKAIGQGMQFRFTEFGFGPDGKPVRVHRPDGTPGTGAEWAFRTFLLPSGYCVSAAVFDAGFGRTFDTRLITMLDAETVEAVNAELYEGP